jgi:regulator of replication initiation timing
MVRYPVRLAAAAACIAVSACDSASSKATLDSLNSQLTVASRARDSLVALMSTAGAEKDKALSEVMETNKFLDQIDAEMKKVRGLTSSVAPATPGETGEATAAAARRAELVDKLQQLRRRLDARSGELRATRATLTRMRADSGALSQTLADLQTRLENREKELAALTQELQVLRAENQRLATEKAALGDTVSQMTVRENKAFYVIGTKKDLIQQGLVEEKGGSRGLLLIVKRGKTLTPGTSLDDGLFTAIDRREVTSISLPKPDKEYQIVSAQDPALVEVAQRKGAVIKGASLKITDPSKFWAPSRYLIIVER